MIAKSLPYIVIPAADKLNQKDVRVEKRTEKKTTGEKK
jgi:hypothetical protein